MKQGTFITKQSLWTHQSVPVRSLFCNMANSAGMKPHHILIIVAHLPIKGRCIGNYGVRSPFSNMKGMYLGTILMLLALEGYLAQFSWSINIDWYALLHPKLSENTFRMMVFNHPKMYERHDRPSYVLACRTICRQWTQIICVRLPDNLQWSNRCKQPY